MANPLASNVIIVVMMTSCLLLIALGKIQKILNNILLSS